MGFSDVTSVDSRRLSVGNRCPTSLKVKSVATYRQGEWCMDAAFLRQAQGDKKTIGAQDVG